MTTLLTNEIPSLDLSDFTEGNSAKKKHFVADLGIAFSEIGFVAVKNHGLNKKLQENLYACVQAFFNLSQEMKNRYEIDELKGQRGYVGKMKEHAKGRTTPDLKEFYHIGQVVDPTDLDTRVYPQNIFPKEIPGIKTYGLQAFEALQNTGIEILRAIALYLELKEDYFDEKVRKGNSILRPIHYFPISDPASVPDDAVRAAEHTDINLITLLMGASADGLQVLRNDGVWIPLTALPNQIVVNVGDMLSRLTNNRLKSTVHRVVNPPRELMNRSRYSIPFFMHPVSSMNLSCLDNCIDDEHPKLFKDITAGDYLEERLKEIGF
jgi:isopenicillin N synthase-like dioxygenase